MKKISGFTILELIIVVIIIGVLAGLALPKLMNMVKAAYAPEAINGWSIIHSAVQRCLLMQGKEDYNTLLQCFNPLNISEKLDIESPFNAPGSHFQSVNGSLSGTADVSCYRIVILLKDEVLDFIFSQYCSGDMSWVTTCYSGTCVKAMGGTTIVGSGAFKGTKIGPGYTTATSPPSFFWW
ncbi:MAG: prepilin-type N-terminal cleavage/methylation domain-containing protein [Candidatus Omnitrophota bacterium]